MNKSKLDELGRLIANFDWKTIEVYHVEIIEELDDERQALDLADALAEATGVLAKGLYGNAKMASWQDDDIYCLDCKGRGVHKAGCEVAPVEISLQAYLEHREGKE